MKKTTIPIKGMHCKSCELLIEDELKSVNCVCRASASHTQSQVHVWHEGDLNHQAIAQAVARAGYQVGQPEVRLWLSRDRYAYLETFLFAVIAVLVVGIVNNMGFKGWLPSTTAQPSSLLIVLIIGLTAGFSTCMALIGGLVLGASVKYSAAHPMASPLEKFTPHLWFNLGRIVGYGLLGALIGAVGSVFQLSGYAIGILTLAVAGVMVLLGLQLTGLFPKLENFKLTLPKQLAGGWKIDHPALMGALTFFLPCGFTQAMQLYALTTGNPVQAGLIMATFALGTAPGLLSIGGLASVVKGNFAQSLFRFAGVVVIGLGIFNVNSSLNLLGLRKVQVQGVATQAVIKNNVQEVRMVQDRTGYSPRKLTVKTGMPVRWIIDAKEPYSCASSLIVPKLSIRKNLQPGENIIEFIPTQTGKLAFSCSMGMYTGEFEIL